MGLDKVDAKNIVPAATQTVTGGFTIQHNDKPAVLLSISGAPVTTQVSDGTTAIADGVKVGQSLVIIVVEEGPSCSATIQNGANTLLHGDWRTPIGNTERAYLHVIWAGAYWVEIGRGFMNTLSGTAASGGGDGNVASGGSSHTEGQSNASLGDYSHTEGRNNTVSASYGHAQGGFNTVSGVYGSAMGKYADATRQFQLAHGGDRFAVDGDAQYSRDVLRRQITHTGSNWHTIGNDGTAVGPVLPADSCWSFRAEVVGATQDIAKAFSYIVTGCIKRIGSTTILQAMNVTTIHEDDSDFDCQAVADDTNEALAIQVRDVGAAGDTVRWVCTLHVTQVTYT